MTVETEDLTRVIQRSSDLAVETARTLVDTAYVAPRQALELGQSVTRAMDANQQLSRDLTEKLVRQSFEAQTLWWQFFQSSMRLAFDSFTRATETGVAAGREQERIITAQTAAAEKSTVAAAQ
jgi:hypothetical protein